MLKVTKRQPAVHMSPLVDLRLILHDELKNSAPYEVRGVKLQSSAWTSLVTELWTPADLLRNLHVQALKDVGY